MAGVSLPTFIFIISPAIGQENENHKSYAKNDAEGHAQHEGRFAVPSHGGTARIRGEIEDEPESEGYCSSEHADEERADFSGMVRYVVPGSIAYLPPANSLDSLVPNSDGGRRSE